MGNNEKIKRLLMSTIITKKLTYKTPLKEVKELVLNDMVQIGASKKSVNRLKSIKTFGQLNYFLKKNFKLDTSKRFLTKEQSAKANLLKNQFDFNRYKNEYVNNFEVKNVVDEIHLEKIKRCNNIKSLNKARRTYESGKNLKTKSGKRFPFILIPSGGQNKK